jgi:16S rRNA processing protein RimM
MYLIGNVLRPQGITGEVKIEPISSRRERFKSLTKVYLKKNSIQTYSIESVRLAGRFVYIKFKEISTRTAAEALRGSEILVEASDVIGLHEGEYFVHDLIACRVFSEQGTYLGEIVDVLQLSSNDVYVLKTPTGREILIPAIRDVIKSITPESKEVIIHLLEGLMD